ncbi:unnamed protein product [Phytophthora lilii]|uniref:Unnamed protein product n=1 Tax=Phytophthora lilii TaxID=2077276 RepID=A0A9W6TQ64_9STRA|nr:unnamed protein product [Phytophthora lilii]
MQHAQQVQEQKKRSEKVTLEDFIMFKVIGKGSFGKVFLVRKRDTGFIYAMKVLGKETISKRNQVELAHTEPNVRHPFIVGLNYSLRHPKNCTSCSTTAQGAISSFTCSSSRSTVHASTRPLAIDYVHNLDLIFRAFSDLKPENALLDENGYIRLGVLKEGIQDAVSSVNTFIGTPEYLAPEILNLSAHSRVVDWWSVGALLYEMLTGLPPFYCSDRDSLFEKIRKGDLSFPKYLSANTKDILEKLLERDPTRRLGAGPTDAGEIKNHPFFAQIQWDALAGPPPWHPTFSDSLGTPQFDRKFTDMPVMSADHITEEIDTKLNVKSVHKAQLENTAPHQSYHTCKACQAKLLADSTVCSNCVSPLLDASKYIYPQGC